mmetsp:Transcript_5797/g.18886  ORF Transcript_5797/g.18886 Transcript_5797/m.18886 type:complete len:392 (-) Transcript_5797:1002-2177(-)
MRSAASSPSGFTCSCAAATNAAVSRTKGWAATGDDAVGASPCQARSSAPSSRSASVRSRSTRSTADTTFSLNEARTRCARGNGGEGSGDGNVRASRTPNDSSDPSIVAASTASCTNPCTDACRTLRASPLSRDSWTMMPAWSTATATAATDAAASESEERAKDATRVPCSSRARRASGTNEVYGSRWAVWLPAVVEVAVAPAGPTLSPLSPSKASRSCPASPSTVSSTPTLVTYRSTSSALATNSGARLIFCATSSWVRTWSTDNSWNRSLAASNAGSSSGPMDSKPIDTRVARNTRRNDCTSVSRSADSSACTCSRIRRRSCGHTDTNSWTAVDSERNSGKTPDTSDSTMKNPAKVRMNGPTVSKNDPAAPTDDSDDRATPTSWALRCSS